MSWRRLAPLAVGSLCLALLGALAAHVILVARWQGDETRLRLQQVARGFETLLGMHLNSDAELLTLFAGTLADSRDAHKLRPGLEAYLARQPHILEVGCVEPDGHVSLLFPEHLPRDPAEHLARRAADAARAGLSRDGFSQIFTCAPGNCISLVRPVRRGATGYAQLVAVYSLDRWIQHLDDHAGLSGTSFLVRGPLGEVLAGGPPAADGRFAEHVLVALDPPGHGLRLELTAPLSARREELIALGMLALTLALTLVGSLAALAMQLRARRRTEGALQSALDQALRAEQHLRLLEGAVEAAANAIILTDRAGRILWTNHAFSTLTGYARREVVGTTPALLRSGRHDAAFYKELWDTILRGEVWRGEITNRRRDGGLYAAEMTITPLRSTGGEITHFVAVKQDVGWRHEADRRVRESEQRFRGLVQSVDAVVWEADPDPAEPDGFRFRFVSERAARILGYPIRSWTEEPGFWFRHLHPEDRAWAPEFCHAEAAAGRSYEAEYRLRTADGRFVWVHDVVRVTTDSDGRPVRLSGVFVDVTRARALEQALKSASDSWRATFDALDIALVVLDESGSVVRLNRTAMELLESDWQECLGRRPWLLHRVEPWIAAEAVVRSHPAESRREVRDEQGRVWDVQAQRVPPSTEHAGMRILTLHDVTRMAELQESLRRAETWRAMGALVAGVAHEVRNPLFAMSANIDALAMVVNGRNDVGELLGALRIERDRLTRLMEELLQYGRPAPVEMHLGEIEPVIEAAVAHCAPLAAARGVRVVRHGAAPGLRLRLNPDRLEEVFVNVVENACQHSAPGAQVRLELERSQDRRGHWLRCRVRDTGPGIAPDALPHVFEPFFTRRKGGTGLGLAIAQRFAAEHGGQLEAENHPEGGAVLTIVLPLGGPTQAV